MYDLNVPWPAEDYRTVPALEEITCLHNTIAMLYLLGYRYVAVNFVVEESVKLPLSTADKLNPIPMAQLREKFGTFKGLHIFSRITLVILDPAKFQLMLKLTAAAAFDIISVQPTTEKALQLTTTNLDIDLVSLPLTTRLPYFIKHKTAGQALSRGIKFEISYLGMISGKAGYELAGVLGVTGQVSRKLFVFNCLQLIRACRSQGIVFSSGAPDPLGVRAPESILALYSLLGLKTSNAKEGFFKNPEAVLVSGRLRVKLHKQSVMVGATRGESSGDTIILGEARSLKGFALKRSAESDRPPKKAKTT